MWVSSENWSCLLKHVITTYTVLAVEVPLLGRGRKFGFPFSHCRDVSLFCINILVFEPSRLGANEKQRAGNRCSQNAVN